MLRSMLAAALAVATMFTAGAASAQGTSPPPINGGIENSDGVIIYSPGQAGLLATTPSRIESSRREMNRAQYRVGDNPRFPTDPGIIRGEAQAAMDRSPERCQVTDATIVGVGAGNTPIFETVCSHGVGFVVLSDRRRVAIECAALAAATADRRADRDMLVVSECRMAGNQMTFERIAGYATEAGVSCDVGQAAHIGRTGEGGVFEVGCRDGSGYWLRRSSAGWDHEDCLKVTALNDTCRLSTAESRIAQLTGRMRSAGLGGGCDVAAVGYVGEAGADDYYEVRCQTGTGYVVQVGSNDAVTAAAPCAEAQATLGAACRLS